MNWGYKLMFVFIAFACMMIYLVYRSFQTNFELVEKTYYESELAYQNIIDGTKLANELSALPQLNQSGDSILIKMPEEMAGRELKGTLWFYCAYDSQNDQKFPMAGLINGSMAYKNSLKPGRYLAKMTWIADSKTYYAEQNLIIK